LILLEDLERYLNSFQSVAKTNHKSHSISQVKWKDENPQGKKRINEPGEILVSLTFQLLNIGDFLVRGDELLVLLDCRARRNHEILHQKRTYQIFLNFIVSFQLSAAF
jgi:hypothetical protein